MATTEGTTVRECTRREQIDEALQRAVSLAKENNQAVKRLRVILSGAPSEEERPERAARPGWLGEIADALGVINEELADTAKVLEEVSQQVATPTPAGIIPSPRR